MTWFNKNKRENATFGREITVAVVLKFMLLAGLWWLFFKGQKLHVNDNMMAAKLFGDGAVVIPVPKYSEKP